MFSMEQKMSELADKIDNRNIRKEVNETHAILHEIFNGLTLFECYEVGYKWSSDKTRNFFIQHDRQRVKDFYLSWKYDNDKRTMVGTFPGYYNNIELQNANIRAKFLQRMVNLDQYTDLILNDVHHMDRIVALSAEAANSSCLLYPIKCYLIGNKHDELDTYLGLQPSTAPVKIALKDMPFYDQVSHSMITAMLAKELNENTTYINTALWILGSK